MSEPTFLARLRKWEEGDPKHRLRVKRTHVPPGWYIIIQLRNDDLPLIEVNTFYVEGPIREQAAERCYRRGVEIGIIEGVQDAAE